MNESMDESIEHLILPRVDLQEGAFRKYEIDIASACFKEHTVIVPTKKASTYISRFRDACLGYKRYGYKSTHIPSGFDVTTLKVEPLADGRVLITNRVLSQKITLNSVLSSETNPSYDTSDMNVIRKILDSLNDDKIVGPIFIRYLTPADKEFLDMFGNKSGRNTSVAFREPDIAVLR